MKIYHILNGDCLAEQLSQTKINKDFIICRESMIDGPVQAKNLVDFWKIRSKFISTSYDVSTQEYYSKTVNEIEKIFEIENHSEVCLWFENDLFCQTNMWFMIFILAQNPSLSLFRVFPKTEKKAMQWEGFAHATTLQLEEAYTKRMAFNQEDLELGKNLWKAYQSSDFNRFKELSQTPSTCFAFLEMVCEAHIDRFPKDLSLGRPEKLIKEIIETSPKDFASVFKEFKKRAGIYGFGDLQIKSMYDKQIHKY